MQLLAAVDRRLGRLARGGVLVLAVYGVLGVGLLDYWLGYEVSMSFFYLAPVALAGWYGGKWPTIAVAVLACATGYGADVAANHPYSHPAIGIWNAFLRFGVFLIIGHLFTTLRASLARQRHLAATDDLTGLYGRRVFADRLAHDLGLAQRRRSALTLAYLDLDNFKKVNDKRGHAAGDRVLRAVGRAMQSTMRRTDTVARLGGDEFALILPDTDSIGARHVVAKLTTEIGAALAATAEGVSCSMGVVTSFDPTISSDRLIAEADRLMYEAKRNGKGAVRFGVLGDPVEPDALADKLSQHGIRPDRGVRR